LSGIPSFSGRKAESAETRGAEPEASTGALKVQLDEVHGYSGGEVYAWLLQNSPEAVASFGPILCRNRGRNKAQPNFHNLWISSNVRL